MKAPPRLLWYLLNRAFTPKIIVSLEREAILGFSQTLLFVQAVIIQRREAFASTDLLA
jgi:hypothetical protein